MAVNWLHKLASRGSVPVFPVLGKQGDGVLRHLALSPQIELVDSPRHASVLLIAGEVPADRLEPLRRVHDQLPDPFTKLWFRNEPWPHLENVDRIDDLTDLPAALIKAHRELMTGQRDSGCRILSDRPPNPWKGEGDFGQGGEGMMGGVPYGRPMAKQFGSPLRLAVPWKYGFKHIKSIVRVSFSDKRPVSFWEELAANEYGFWANVNPQVPHPRWSQARERRIGDFLKRPTKMFNGYEEEVGQMYAGMDLRKNY